MIADAVPFGSAAYFVFLGLLMFSRAMDFLSTWTAPPNLLLEANPIARKLGWRWGIPVNIVLCAAFAAWPLPAVIVSTTSVLVAARNFQSAWLMRSMGEEDYRYWMTERLAQTSFGLFLFCLLGQATLISAVGGALIWFGDLLLVPLGVGIGLVGYAAAVVLYTLISVWRKRRPTR